MRSVSTHRNNLQIATARSLDELKSHAPQYSRLITRLRGLESLYYSLTWIEAVYPLYESGGARMMFLLVYRDHELIGAAPFQTTSHGKLWPKFTKLQFWGAVDCYAKNVHQNILCANDQDRELVLDQLTDYLIHCKNADWDVIEFYRVNLQESCLREFTERFPDGVIVENSLKSYCFKSPCTIDERLNRKERWAIRDAGKRMARDFSTHSIKIIDKFSDVHMLCMNDLHTRRQELLIQNGAQRDTFLDNSLSLAAIEQLITQFHHQDKVRCYQLIVEGNVVAFLLIFADKDEALLLVTAFDDHYRKYHPSRYLWHAAFKNEIENLGIRLIDTSYGETIIKRDFSTHTYDLHDIEIWRPGRNLYTACKIKALKGIRTSKAQLLSWYLTSKELCSKLSFCGFATAFC